MLNNKDEVIQYLNQEIPYWQGIRSREFWKEIAAKSSVKMHLINLSVIVAGTIYLGLITEVRNNNKLFSLLGLAVIVCAIAIYDFLKYLLLFQAKTQLEIIRQAQQAQESKSEQE